jgi:hypothetical protein
MQAKQAVKQKDINGTILQLTPPFAYYWKIGDSAPHHLGK